MAIAFIGYQVAKMLRRLAQRAIDRGAFDKTLGRFVINLLYYAILLFVMMAALDQLGVDTTSLVAVVGAAGLAFGLAMEGALANFAAGVMIIILRPFKEGDYVEATDTIGRVEEIHIVQTRLVTFENETVVLPNRDVTDGKIVNFSARGYVELELPYYIDYTANLDAALQVLSDAVSSSPFTVESPPSSASVLEMESTAIKLLIEANINPEDRENATYDINKRVADGFKSAEITMPIQRWRNVA